MRMTGSMIAALSVLCLLQAKFVQGGEVNRDIHGIVATAGAPLGGAIVTIQASGSAVQTSVYCNPDGHFSVAPKQTGTYSVRARYPGREDAVETLQYDVTSSQTVNFELPRATDPLKNSPSSIWLSLLPDDLTKRKFIVNCGTCHELSHTRIYKDGKVRDQDQWSQAISLMKSMDAYSVIPPELHTDQYARWLASNLSAEGIGTLKARGPTANPSLRDAVITEYAMPQADELPHDIALGNDHHVWITGFWHSEMVELDPVSAAFRAYPVAPPGPSPAQVRALQMDRLGKFWIVLGGTKSVVHFDPSSGHYDTFPIGMYAHDIVLDSHGDAWFNDYFSKPERIGRLRATGGAVQQFPLPSANLTQSEGKPLPYGLQIDSRDRLWSTQLAGNTIVRFDSKSRQSKLYTLPVEYSGPRRHAIASDGSIWIPEFATGYLTHFDPKHETFTRFNLGDSGLGPYAVAIDPVSGKVWVAAALGSALIRFDPKTHMIDNFPLPTEPAYMRHLAVDPQTGDVWSAYSSLPSAAPKVVRLSAAGSR